MQSIEMLRSVGWDGQGVTSLQATATRALEDGKVLFLCDLSFPLLAEEIQFLSPRTVRGAKNVGFDPKTGQLTGAAVASEQIEALRGLLDRFAWACQQLLHHLLPGYRDGLQLGRTSLRPVEIEHRVSSWRKDDTRLHVDSFPSMPTAGHRLLRVFSNINPVHRPRVWRLGEPFEAVARRFWSKLQPPAWGSALALRLFGVTKALRTPYDHYMLQLHDRMKEDQRYQETVEQTTFSFPPGSSWIAFTDQVSHATMSGIHQLEQTFYLPVTSLRNPGTAPLRVLEQLAARKIA